ncbi:hypothetical protein PM082_000786 [Marasmius tenuissimus]|nr:hypothetical protein PM082_000786 [Marasmius tenuissimus]
MLDSLEVYTELQHLCQIQDIPNMSSSRPEECVLLGSFPCRFDKSGTLPRAACSRTSVQGPPPFEHYQDRDSKEAARITG